MPSSIVDSDWIEKSSVDSSQLIRSLDDSSLMMMFSRSALLEYRIIKCRSESKFNFKGEFGISSLLPSAFSAN